jgi:hypothetical protein
LILLGLPDPTEPTCQFVFLPNGWELRIIYDKGPVTPWIITRFEEIT